MPEDKNKHLSSDKDSQLFREFVGDTKPLVSDEQYSFEGKPKPKPIKKVFNLKENLHDVVFQEADNIQATDSLFFSRDGLQHKTIKKLKRGAFAIDEKIDLHGLNKQEAQLLLYEFLTEQASQHRRCLLIVHGKGMGSLNSRPVLKNLVFKLLKNEPSVLAFTSAQARDGGTGAVYVLLRKTL